MSSQLHHQHPHLFSHHQGTSMSSQRLLQRHSPKKISNIPADIENPPFYLPLLSFASRYRVISSLGNGSFGDVTLAKTSLDLNDAFSFKSFRNTLLERNDGFQNENYYNKKTGLVAIKTMTKRLPLLHDYTRVKEIRFILAIPYHKNLVQIYEMFIDNSDFKLHIVMECMDQNLYQLIKARKHNHFSQHSLKSLLSQILNGIRHIHHNNYFHRDIKPENILVSPSNRFYSQEYLKSDSFQSRDNFIVKIADYGLARHIDNKRPYTSYVSTRWYRAPEILLRKNWYSRPVDIWAFGSVASEVATFRPLFPGSNEYEQTWKVLEVLGTPDSTNCYENYLPSYGYWDEVNYLSTQLGFNFPQKRCIDISHIIQNPELEPLCDVIRACLAWNPSTRADVDKICQMKYFKGTCVDTETLVESHKKPTFNNQLSKSENLLGLRPILPTAKIPSFYQSHNGLRESPMAGAFNSTSSTNGISLSFLNEESPSKDCDLHMLPNLTQESLQSINDENYNSLSSDQFNFQTLQPRQYKIGKPMDKTSTMNIQSTLNDHKYNSTITCPKSNCHETLQEYTYKPLDMDNNIDIDPMVTQGEEYIDWDRVNAQDQVNEELEDDIKGFTNLQLLLDENELSDERIELYESYAKNQSDNQDVYKSDPELKDFIQDLENPTADQSTNEFSGKLYSKYNLRRLSNQPEDISSNNSCLVDYTDTFETY